MEQKNEKYTQELQNVLSYMTDILANEFPTKIFTPEYLMMSILDNKNSRAHMILDNCLMSENMENLKKIYTDFLKSHMQSVVSLEKDASFNDELNKIMSVAEEEATKIVEENVGTEHVLLAILRPDTGGSPLRDVLNSMGVEYGFIFNKCNEAINERKRQQNQQQQPPFTFNGGLLKPAIFPLKGEVNVNTTIPETENIKKYTLNLNEQARRGKLDKLVGREKEINQIIKILARRKKNNVVLVGDGGVGKTQIVYGLASLIEDGNVPPIIQGKQLLMLDVMAIISGTHYRGMYEERVKGLFDELKSSNNYILVIDDMQNVLKNGDKNSDADMSGMINNILSEGEVRVIGTTTFKAYRNSIEANSSISRKLQKVVVEPTTTSEALTIIENAKDAYENYHCVEYTEGAIQKSVELADRYITDRKLPDSAFDVLDLSGAYSCFYGESEEITECRKKLKTIMEKETAALNSGNFELVEQIDKEKKFLKKMLSDYKRDTLEKHKIVISEEDVARTVSEMTNIPISKLSSNEKQKIADIDKTLKQSVIGQDEAINAICKVIKRNKIGLGSKTKTMGNFLFGGSTSTGKCVSKRTKIKIRNKKTLEIQELTIEEFIKLACSANK